jgi:pantoate--beta-alanine ligase
MLTVVLKLLNLTRAQVAFFGEKDAQQLVAVRRMVADLSEPVRIVGVPTVRDPDGLALSSRNALLSPLEREQALALHRALTSVVAGVDNGGSLADALVAARAALANAPGIDLDYLDALDPASGMPLSSEPHGEAIVAVAARVGQTRLIDNVRVHLGGRGSVSA